MSVLPRNTDSMAYQLEKHAQICQTAVAAGGVRPEWARGQYPTRPAGRLRGEDLRNLDLRHVLLTNTDLREADLRGSDLSCASLTGSCFRGARLEGVNLAYATLTDADLMGAFVDEGKVVAFLSAFCYETNVFWYALRTKSGAVILQHGTERRNLTNRLSVSAGSRLPVDVLQSATSLIVAKES